jgi:hypothetical protein
MHGGGDGCSCHQRETHPTDTDVFRFFVGASWRRAAGVETPAAWATAQKSDLKLRYKGLLMVNNNA